MYGVVALLLSCGEDPASEDVPTVVGLSGAALADRISLDMRGVHASAEELAQAEAEGVASLTEAWLDDPRFPERVAWIWNDTLHTALWFDDYPRFGELSFNDWRAMGQEPLRLIADVVERGAPLSEILTSESLVADETLAGWWPVEREAGDGWTPSVYTDGRPMAGLLSSSSLWQRYNGDITNRNRGRANALTRAFLCADFFDRDVEFDFALDAEDLERMENAVREQQSCLACHAALDPLASFFGGYTERSQEEPLEQYTQYSPWTASWYAAWTQPAWFGHPGGDLVDLGAMIAADPRFATCAVQRIYEGFVGTTLEDADALASLTEGFRASDMDVRALVAAIVETDAYRDAELRLLSPEQISSSLSDSLGLPDASGQGDGLNPLTWTEDHRVLLGGGDDHTVLERQRTPGLGVGVIQLWAARQATSDALSEDAAREPEVRVLWTVVEPYAASPTEADLRAQLAEWRTRLHGELVEPDGPGMDGLVSLWQAAAADPTAAWEQALAALIRHPSATLY